MQRTTLASNADWLNSQRARRPVASAKSNIQFNKFWSVQIVKCVTSRYGRIISTDETVVRHSCCVVLYACSTFVSDRDQYLTDSGVPLRCSCSSTHPT